MYVYTHIHINLKQKIYTHKFKTTTVSEESNSWWSPITLRLFFKLDLNMKCTSLFYTLITSCIPLNFIFVSESAIV